MTVSVQPRLTDVGPTLIDVTFVVFDLETTGGSAASDRITEIGAVKVRGGERLGELSTLVHPGRPIPGNIQALTGISDAMVARFPRIEGLLAAFLEFSRGSVLVAHNARFDVGFMNAALERAGHPTLDHPVIDTVALARRLVRDEVRNLRLATLAKHLRAQVSPCHRALPDAQATVDVLHALLERAGSLGAVTLADVQDLCRAKSMPAYRRRDLVAHAPEEPGVYRFLDARDEVLYVGKATNLRQRLQTYFGMDDRRRIAEMVRRAKRVDWSLTATELEANVREVREIGELRPPYNRRSRDPQKRVHVAWTQEPFPRLVASRAVGPSRASLLGPIAPRLADGVIEAVNDAMGLRSCRPRLRVRQDHSACALKELGRCGAPCDGTLSRGAHAELVADVAALFTHGPAPALEALAARMHAAANGERFETARRLRDTAEALAAQLCDQRRRDAITAVPWLVAARPSRRRVATHAAERGTVAFEVVWLRHGRVAASRLVNHLDDVSRVTGRGPSTPPPRTSIPLPGQHLDALEAEEVALVLRWLWNRDARLLDIDGAWAEPWIGVSAAEAMATRGRAQRSTRDEDRTAQLARRRQATGAPAGTSASGVRRRTKPSGW